MKKILVTGASGFIGRHCIDLLTKRGYEIHAISRISGENQKNVTWYKIDLFDSIKIEQIFNKVKPTFFMHLAWKMETGLNLNSDINKKWFHLSVDLINLFYKYGGKRILISGSCFEYEFKNKILCENDTPLNPNNEYGRNKNKLFQYLKSFSSENGLSYAWGRIFFAYGPGQKSKSLLPYVISNVLDDKIVKTTDGNQMYDYIYIKDVALALVLILESTYDGPVNISSGKVIKLKDLILKIAKKLGKEDLIKFGAIERPNGSPEYLLGNNELLKKITNWKINYPLDKGVSEFIDSYKLKNL